MKIKVCGMTSVDQMHQLDELGVDFAGMIFYPNSPRYVKRHGLAGAEVKKAKLKVYKVGVFVNAAQHEIMEAVKEYGLDMVQLHGHETPYECAKVSEYIHVIKAFRFAENDHVEWMIKDYYEDADMFLFDTGVPVSKEERESPVLYGGTGRKFNWNRLKGLNISKPYFLSGGIEPGDSSLVHDFCKDPVAKNMAVVDINSRFEDTPGVKNMSLVSKFVDEIKEG
jgi:phosphoribosylanthranilate isomerase